jgi:protein SCO1
VHEAFRKDPDALCVSITVDPDRDTPEVLRGYAAKYGASEDRWLYLRGPVKEVLALSYGGFRIGDAEDPLIHSQRFVLVDRRGRIRGYYRGTESEEVERLLSDYRLIRGEAP